MKNLRFLITVLALVNAGLIAQAAAAPSNTSGGFSNGGMTTQGSKIIIGSE